MSDITLSAMPLTPTQIGISIVYADSNYPIAVHLIFGAPAPDKRLTANANGIVYLPIVNTIESFNTACDQLRKTKSFGIAEELDVPEWLEDDGPEIIHAVSKDICWNEVLELSYIED